MTLTKTYKLLKGTTLWLSGLSGSGKSTLTDNLVKILQSSNENFPLEILDGDVVREHLCKDLGFSKEDRLTNIERIAFLAGKISKHKVLTLVPVIAPYQSARDQARNLSEEFLLVYVKADIESVKARDPKGLYKKAVSGEIKNFTGISDPYEEPLDADLIIETDKASIENCLEQVIDFLVKKQVLEEQ